MSEALSRLARLAPWLPTPARPAAAPVVRAGGGLGQDTVSTTPSPVRSKLDAKQAAAYGRLSPGVRAAFDRVYLATAPMGQRELRAMLGGTMLTGSRDLEGGASLLVHLDRLARQTLAPGVDRRFLLSSVVQQVANPGEISQGGRGTCTVTTVEYMVAKQAPAEYARIIADLATGDGTVRLASGKFARRVPDSTGADDSGRTEASRLFEAAMMDFGNGLLSYSNKTDKNGIGAKTFLPGGLSNGQTTRVVNAVLDEHYRSIDAVPLLQSVPFTSLGHGQLMRKLGAALAQGQMVPMGLDWRGEKEWKPSGHEVLALKIENGRVYYRNPWGNSDAPGAEVGGPDSPRRRIEDRNGLESMTLAELEARITGISAR